MEADRDTDVPRSLAARVWRLGVNSSLYSIASVLTQGLQFFLVPLYTRVLTPADFGILSFTSTLYSFLSIVLGLSVGTAVGRLYFEAQTPESKRTLYGTLLLFHVVAPTLIVIGIDAWGMSGGLDLFGGVPYRPYLRITLWAAYCYLFQTIPLGVYTASQRPRQVILLTVGSTALTVGLALYLIVIRRLGVVGALTALLVSNGVFAAISLILMIRMSSLHPSLRMLKRALAYTVPLVPHLIAGWGISLSDRILLQPRVSLEALGLYSLGCQVASVVSLVAASINSAVSPMVLGQLKSDRTDEVPVLGTYALAAIAFVCLGTSVLGGDAIHLLVPKRFYGAAAFIPWVALGNGFLGVYFIWSLGTWFSMRTMWIPISTAAAFALNIGLNLWLIPRYGAYAAAVTTCVSYLALALFHGALASMLHRVDWEYGRWARLVIVGLACFALARALMAGSLWLRILIHTVVVFFLFPLGLAVSGFVRPGEWRFLRQRWVELRSRRI